MVIFSPEYNEPQLKICITWIAYKSCQRQYSTAMVVLVDGDRHGDHSITPIEDMYKLS